MLFLPLFAVICRYFLIQGVLGLIFGVFLIFFQSFIFFCSLYFLTILFKLLFLLTCYESSFLCSKNIALSCCFY